MQIITTYIYTKGGKDAYVYRNIRASVSWYDGAMFKTRMLRLLAVCALIIGCAAAPRITPPSSHERPAERWVIVMSPEVAKVVLAERPATQDIVPPRPGQPMVLATQARVPAIRRADLIEAAARALLKLYGDLPIEFAFASAAPSYLDRPDTFKWNVCEIRDADKDGRLFGMAEGIDYFNLQHMNKVAVYMGTMVKYMRRDASRLIKNPRTGSVILAAPSTDEIGKSLGGLIAHEVGHALGLRHNPREQEEDKMKIMTQGVAKYGQKDAKTNWMARNRLYLWAVLNKLPFPPWVVDLLPDEAENARPEAPQCAHCKIGVE